MPTIGRFIDAACARHPDLMREALDRPFGDLGHFVMLDENDDTCGCLVGTMGVVAGALCLPRWRGGRVLESRRAIEAAADMADVEFEDADWVGMDVYDMARRYIRHGEPREIAHARTVALIKRRIARRLGAVATVCAEAAHAAA